MVDEIFVVGKKFKI